MLWGLNTTNFITNIIKVLQIEDPLHAVLAVLDS